MIRKTFTPTPQQQADIQQAFLYIHDLVVAGNGTVRRFIDAGKCRDGLRELAAAYRNKRDVWTVNTDPFPEAHFATFPPALILPCVLAGCPTGGTILDPFSGAGTTALVAKENGRKCVGIELSADYVRIAEKRLSQNVFPFTELQGTAMRDADNYVEDYLNAEDAERGRG